MTDLRTKHGLIDAPPVYEVEPDFDRPFGWQKPKGLYCQTPTRYIVFDTPETEKIAIKCAQGQGQKWEVETGHWRVEEDKSKMRQRMEGAGLEFTPLGREYLNSPVIYRISQKAKMA